MKYLSVGSALLVVGINHDDEIFQFVKSDWLQIAGKLRNITVTIDGILYGTNDVDDIFYSHDALKTICRNCQ